jgi:diguanylate cyclase (GGDEF)-like protein
MTIFHRVLAKWDYLFVFTPFLTDIIESGHFPVHPREYVTEVVVGILIAVGVAIIHRDLAKLRTIAETDALTGLLNRRRFMGDLGREVKLSGRLGAQLSVIYVDVNDFKLINDAHGHAEGDAVLREVGTLLHHVARRDVDFCYRLGGDEFALLLIGVADSQAEEMLGRIQVEAGEAYPHLHRHGTTLSCGVAHLREGESTKSFLHRADTMMYKRKMERQRLSQQDPIRSFRTVQNKMFCLGGSLEG